MSRTIVVTGANRGIGLEFARQLVDAGDFVIAGARKPDEARALQELAGPHLEIHALDVASDASVSAFASAVGERAVDVLINNAGVGGGGAPIVDLDLKRMRDVLEVNAIGPLRVTQAMLPALHRADSPVVAHITSRMGSIGDNSSGGYYAYRMSKAALNMANKSLSMDGQASGIVCVVLHPGWVKTDMGGASAPLSVDDSVRGLLKVINGLSRSDSGRFFDYKGAELPW